MSDERLSLAGRSARLSRKTTLIVLKINYTLSMSPMGTFRLLCSC